MRIWSKLYPLVVLMATIRVAQAAMLAQSLTLKAGENHISSIVIDEHRGVAYVAVSQSPFRYSMEGSSASIIVVRLADMRRLDTLTLQAGENPLDTGFLDSSGSCLIYGVYGDPHRGLTGEIVKIGINPLKRLKALSFKTEDYGISSSAIDRKRNTGYFGTLYGNVVGVRLEDLTQVGSLSLQREDNAFQAGVVDSSGTNAYFGTASGNLMKIKLSDFSPIGNITLLRGDQGIRTNLIDQMGTYIYIGTGESPARIIRVKLKDFSLDRSLSFDEGESDLRHAFWMPNGLAGYVLLNQGANLIRVKPYSMERIDSIPLLPATVGDLSAVATDNAGKTIYFGGGESPAIFYKVRLSPNDIQHPSVEN